MVLDRDMKILYNAGFSNMITEPKINPEGSEDDESKRQDMKEMERYLKDPFFFDQETKVFKHHFAKRYEVGDTFGELGIMRMIPRSATAVCAVDCVFGLLNAKDFRKILNNEQKQKIEKRMTFFKKNLLFDLDYNDQVKISYFFTKKIKKKGQLVFEQGKRMTEVILIRKGELELSLKLNLDLFELSKQSDMLPIERSIVSMRTIKEYGVDNYISWVQKVAVATQSEFLGGWEVYRLNKVAQFTAKVVSDQCKYWSCDMVSFETIIETFPKFWKNIIEVVKSKQLKRQAYIERVTEIKRENIFKQIGLNRKNLELKRSNLRKAMNLVRARAAKIFKNKAIQKGRGFLKSGESIGDLIELKSRRMAIKEKGNNFQKMDSIDMQSISHRGDRRLPDRTSASSKTSATKNNFRKSKGAGSLGVSRNSVGSKYSGIKKQLEELMKRNSNQTLAKYLHKHRSLKGKGNHTLSAVHNLSLEAIARAQEVTKIQVEDAEETKASSIAMNQQANKSQRLQQQKTQKTNSRQRSGKRALRKSRYSHSVDKIKQENSGFSIQKNHNTTHEFYANKSGLMNSQNQNLANYIYDISGGGAAQKLKNNHLLRNGSASTGHEGGVGVNYIHHHRAAHKANVRGVAGSQFYKYKRKNMLEFLAKNNTLPRQGIHTRDSKTKKERSSIREYRQKYTKSEIFSRNKEDSTTIQNIPRLTQDVEYHNSLMKLKDNHRKIMSANPGSNHRSTNPKIALKNKYWKVSKFPINFDKRRQTEPAKTIHSKRVRKPLTKNPLDKNSPYVASLVRKRNKMAEFRKLFGVKRQSFTHQAETKTTAKYTGGLDAFPIVSKGNGLINSQVVALEPRDQFKNSKNLYFNNVYNTRFEVTFSGNKFLREGRSKSLENIL